MNWICTVDFEKQHAPTLRKDIWISAVGSCRISIRVLEHIRARHASNDKIGIVYAYLRYDSPETQDPSNLLRAFIKQLCFRKELDPLLLGFFDEYFGDARIPLFENFESHLNRLAKPFTEIFIVPDAQQRKKIFKMILKLVNELPCAKVFVTSRKEADTTKKFSQLNEPTIEIEAKNNADDIEIYVRGQVGSLISGGDLQLQDDSLQEKTIQEHALNDHQENKRMIGDGISFNIYI